MYTVVTSPSYILPKCAKTREPKDEHCVLWCSHISYNIHEPYIPGQPQESHSTALHNNILNEKREPPTLRLKKLIEVLSQYSFKVKFMRGKDMTISDFLSRHPGQDLASTNEIIPISFQSRM